MDSTKHIFFVYALISTSFIFSQKLGFDKVLKSNGTVMSAFCVPNNEQNLTFLETNEVQIKLATKNWIFFEATPKWVQEKYTNEYLSDFYFEATSPTLLSDSARMHHKVDQVHNGAVPLNSPYTGKGVIIGVVDTGIDWQHPDFKDSSGNTRILRYWDHSLTGTAPTGFSYGHEWDSTAINSVACTSNDQSAHGTTVAGIAAGNGLANGTNTGMAPDANLVIVETSFALPNWTLTILDAVQYIFDVADEYDMPAVVNLSLGTYLGSHDGTDPAAEGIEALLDEKDGRIVVCALGNSGGWDNYHQGDNVDVDTNFVWFENNPTGALGANTIFFDVWSDAGDETFQFAFAADAPDYTLKGRTNFRSANNLATSPVYDTIWEGTNRIATIETYNGYENGNFHMQVFFRNVDSTDFLYRFETTGSGRYDLWSGSPIGYNDMVQTADLPSTAQMPHIVNYVAPDSLQSLVSSWNCSEKVVSVSNMQNRYAYVNLDGNPRIFGGTPGKRSNNSSRGPSRKAYMKPEVIAAGDGSLAAGPLLHLGLAGNRAIVDSGGWHYPNGGTSMSSPVVAGIAALYLERCSKSSYTNFIEDIKNTAYTDLFTGTVPNFEYGYGKIDAFSSIQELQLENQPSISYYETHLAASASSHYQWFIDSVAVTGDTNQNINFQTNGTYQVMTTNEDGCSAMSEPFEVNLNVYDLTSEEITVYPNPAFDQLEVISPLKIERIECYDLKGNKIPLSFSEGKIKVNHLSSGFYILELHSASGIYFRRLSKL